MGGQKKVGSPLGEIHGPFVNPPSQFDVVRLLGYKPSQVSLEERWNLLSGRFLPSTASRGWSE